MWQLLPRIVASVLMPLRRSRCDDSFAHTSIRRVGKAWLGNRCTVVRDIDVHNGIESFGLVLGRRPHSICGSRPGATDSTVGRPGRPS
jgi:hypothetical protein